MNGGEQTDQTAEPRFVMDARITSHTLHSRHFHAVYAFKTCV